VVLTTSLLQQGSKWIGAVLPHPLYANTDMSWGDLYPCCILHLGVSQSERYLKDNDDTVLLTIRVHPLLRTEFRTLEATR